jgi:ribosome-associated translation inhibitor RaiA
MRSNEITAMPRPALTVRGEFGEGLAELLTRKLVAAARHAHQPVLAIRVELDRHPDPAVARPVVAKVSVDLNGRQVHAAATARTAREAVDRMVERMVRQFDDRPRTPRRRRRTSAGAIR